MANLASVLENFFTIASETFTDNLSASISAGAATVPVNNASEYAEGDRVVLTVDPGTVNEATFLGVKDTGNQFINCKWTEGNTAVGHDSGATIIDYDSATHHNAQTKGILEFADQQGNLLTQAVRDALNLGSSAVNGWEVLPYTLQVSSGYNKGNKEFDLVVPNNDLTDELSAGMKLRIGRNITAPTQCADFESSSSQYGVKTSPSGISFTDDITIEGWLKLESYPASAMTILSRWNGTSGWDLHINSIGQLSLSGFNAGAANESYNIAYQAIELGKWTHFAITLDMSAFSAASSPIYLDGVSIPNQVGRTGTNPTALIQAGNLELGSRNGGLLPFDGEMADIRLWNAVRTGTQIRDNMNQQLVGSETNLIFYAKLNGNLNDSTTNANNLTGSGGLVATTVDNPMKNTEYAVVTKVAYSAPNTTITVFTGTDHNIPNMTLTAPYYSTQQTPYGFPVSRSKWRVSTLLLATYTKSVGSVTAWYVTPVKLSVPVGAWKLGYLAQARVGGTSGAAAVNGHISLTTNSSDYTTTTVPQEELKRTSWGYVYAAGAAQIQNATSMFNQTEQELNAQTMYALSGNVSEAGGAFNFEFYYGTVIFAECAYV